jgi:hypothetical protein
LPGRFIVPGVGHQAALDENRIAFMHVLGGDFRQASPKGNINPCGVLPYLAGISPTMDLAGRLAGRRDDPAYNEDRAVEDKGAHGIEFEGNSEHSAFYGNRVRPAE